MNKTIIKTDNAPKAVGPYNQAVVVGDFVFVSGQLAIDPKTNEFLGGDIVAQTRKVFENVKAVLEACGCGFNNVVKCNVFLKDINDFSVMNKIYGEYFDGCDYPARIALEVANIPLGALIEIEVIAAK